MEYSPNDAGLTVAVLSYLESHPELLAAAAEMGRETPAEVTRLRKGHPAEMARGALAVAEARRKARRKFDHPEGVWGSPEAVEQASGTDVARHKAARIGAYLGKAGGEIWDLCTGIGGDAMALMDVGSLTAVEMSPVRVWCLERNLRSIGKAARVICGMLTPALEVAGENHGGVFHIDPSRRSAGRRFHRYEDLIPGADVIDALMRRFEAGAIKLSPAVDFESLPAGQLELISSDGTVVQAMLWVGALARAGREATVIRGGKQVTVSGLPEVGASEVVSPEGYLYEVDGAVHRAGLAGALCGPLGLRAVTAEGGYVTGDGRGEHLALTRFRHLATVPYAEKRVTEALKQLEGGSGPVEVKTRGGLGLDTDKLQRQFTAAAACGATVMIYRGWEGKTVTLICRREV